MKKNSKIFITAMAAILVLMAGTVYYTSSDYTKREKEVILEGMEKKEVCLEVAEETVTRPTEGAAENIYVHVCGEVVEPGVYSFSVGARIYDAVIAAKGLTKEAAETSINQARAVVDGEQIYIPSKKEIKKQQREDARKNNDSVNDKQEAEGKVRINTATLEELMTLPGIGEAKAKSILQYKEEHGSFQSIEEIKNIQGIKEGVFSKIKEYITL